MGDFYNKFDKFGAAFLIGIFELNINTNNTQLVTVYNIFTYKE